MYSLNSARARLRMGLGLLSRDQWLIFFAYMLWGFGKGLWFHLQPLYIEFLGAHPSQIGFVLSLAGVAVMFLFVPAGLLADRQRRKPIMMAGWMTGTAAALGMALAPDWRWIIPGLALYLLASFSGPATSGYIAASERGGNVTRSFAIITSGFAMGGVASPAVGGWIAAQAGLRAVYFVAAGFYALSTLTIWQLTDLPAPARARDFRPRFLIADRGFLWQVFVLLVMFFALDLGVVLAPKYLQDVKGLPVQRIGQLGTAAAVGMVVLTLGLGYLRAERRTPLFLNQLAIATALILLWNAPPGRGDGLHGLILFVAYFLRGGDVAAFTITRSRFSHWLPPEVLSLGFGFLDTASQIALTASPYVAGLLYARDPALPLYGGLLALCVSMLLTLTLPGRHRHRPAGAPAASPEPSAEAAAAPAAE